MDLDTLLHQAVLKNASDVYLKANTPPMARIYGKVEPLTTQKLSSQQTLAILKSLIPLDVFTQFEITKEHNFAYVTKEEERFRCNAYFQRGDVGVVFRLVKDAVPEIEDLNLPLQLKELVLARKGLILVTGPTGSGKSTSLASMINYRNAHQKGHIITIEDPIEYIYEENKSIISQREVGLDTVSFDNALKNALRQAPDVVSIGEIRDLDTAITAMAMAETGHLVLATLHATNTYQSLERLISMFTADKEKQLLMTLSMNLIAVLSQRLIPRKNTEGRIVATELLLNTPRIKELVRENNLSQIKDYLKSATEEGMHTFDQSIHALFEAGEISDTHAISYADSEGEMRMKLKGFKGSLQQV